MPKVRIIALSDQHMSNNLPYAKPSNSGGITDRLVDQINLWSQVEKLAQQYSVDAVFSLGDLYDKGKVDPITLTQTTKSLVSLSKHVPVYILPGNHDAVSVKGEHFNVEAYRYIGHDVHCFKTFQPHEYSLSNGLNLHFWAVEYMRPKETLIALERIRRSSGYASQNINVLLFHNSVVGCEHLAWICDDGLTPEQLLDGFDWAIGGHFHTHQKFGSEEQGMYCGSWMQHDFSDIGERQGCWLIEWDEVGKRNDVFLPLESPRFWTREPAVIPDMATPGDYLRWIVKATHSDFLLMKNGLDKSKKEAETAGFRVDYKHEPIHQHVQRIIKHDELSTITMEQMVGRYVDSDTVEIGGLDKQRLKQLGREILKDTV